MNVQQEFDNELNWIRSESKYSNTTTNTPTEVLADYTLRLIVELRKPRTIKFLQFLWIRISAYAYYQAEKLEKKWNT